MENVFSPTKEGQEWGSHLPALIACVAASTGPVLEIGCGHYSTPCLHALCLVLDRQVVTLEVEDLWRKQFEHYEIDTMHCLEKQTDAQLVELSKEQWGVVFVDDLAGSRVSRGELFFDSAEFILFHDANFPQFQPALYDWVKTKNCQSFVYDRYAPHTLIVSKFRPIPNFA